MRDGLEDWLRRLVERGKTPGIQYAWADRNGAEGSYCAGWADLRERRPMTAATPLMAYSMSKVLTAHAVWRLAGVALDEPLQRFVPGTPYGGEVTLRQLLKHRSGIPNPIPLRWVHPAAAHAGFDEGAALEEQMRRHPRLAFAPGTRRLYSNLGYWLLGRVVERVTGRRFTDFVEEEVLRPWRIGPDEIGYAGETRGYLERFSLLNLVRPWITDPWIAGAREGRWVEIAPHYVNGAAFGGAIGTAAGFCRLGLRLLESGDPGWGWEERDGVLQKEGGGAGFHFLLRLDRRRGRVSVVMANAAGLDVQGCLDRPSPSAMAGEP